MESSGPRYGPARGGQPYRDDRGGSRGGYQGDRGGYQGDRGGYQGDRGGYQGDRGGYQGDRGGYQGDRGGYQGDRGGNQRPYDSSQGPRDAQRFERAPDRDGADLPEAEPRASVTPEGGTGLAPPLAVLLAAAARELVLTLSVDAEADLEPGEGPTEAEGADDAASTEVTAGAESVEGHGSADAESPQAQAVTADASRDRVGASAQSDAAPSEPAADAATDASDFAHATQDAESSEGEPQDAPAAYRSPSTPPEPIRSVLHQLDPISRRAVQDIRYEGLRHFGLTQVIVNQWGRQHPPLAVEALVAVALGQLDSGRRPAHTVVSQAVDACDLVPGCDWARGFVNAMLRRVLRETRQVEYWMANEPVARFNAPDEWIDRLAQRLGPLAERALDGSTLRAPMTLRVNRRAMARKQGRASMSASDAAHAYRGMLYQAGIGADLTAVYGGKKSRFEVPAAIRLRQPVGVSHLPGFAEGLVSVQDAAAQLAAELLQVERGQRVLDACAAPGGKTCHLLESADCEVTAVDVSAARLAMVADNLKRLGLEATLIEGDAAKPEAWWDGQPFDRILLDAPCTASGVVRRHPEIPWIRQQAAIERVAALQLTMLGQLWPLLKPGGVMLFVTCSILPDEGERQVRRFAERQTDVEILPSPGLLVPQQRGEADHDGFFYALLRKPA